MSAVELHPALAVLVAARQVKAAEDAVKAHAEPRSGPEFETKVEAWSQAYRQLMELVDAAPGDQP